MPSAAVVLLVVFALWLGAGAPVATADDIAGDPKPVPITRPDVKQALERLKGRAPRLPLPPPAAGERAANNGRMRSLYLPEELRGGGFSREPDPNMTLDYGFATMLFWITSRVNNCHYCLGHQENKLLAAGVDEDRIAALDGDWSEFSAAERAAFGFTRKLTYEPFALTDDDVAALRRHFGDVTALEIVLLAARYNSTNRWTDALGIPQEDHRDFATPTSSRFRELVTRVAPAEAVDASPAAVACAAVPAPRPAVESRSEIEAGLAAARQRVPRLPLVDEAAARALLPEGEPDGPLPQWVRLLANFPRYGTGWIASHRAAADKGRLAPLPKAQIAWIAARHDRAWYALGHAERRLLDLGLARDEIDALAAADDRFRPGERAAFRLAEKLTVAPQHVVDRDIAELREHYSDHEVAEIVYHVTLAAFFNRLTEAAGLQLEE